MPGVAGGGVGLAAGRYVIHALISAAILWILKNAARDIYRRVMDSTNPEMVDRASAVLAAVPGLWAIDAVRLRLIGHQLRAEVEVVSNRELSLVAARAIAVEAQHRLLHDGVPRLSDAIAHTSPCSHDGSTRIWRSPRHLRSADQQVDSAHHHSHAERDTHPAARVVAGR